APRNPGDPAGSEDEPGDYGAGQPDQPDTGDPEPGRFFRPQGALRARDVYGRDRGVQGLRAAIAEGAAMILDVFDIGTAWLGVSLLLALSRAAIGPSLPDRVVALELTSMTSVGIILVRAVSAGQPY